MPRHPTVEVPNIGLMDHAWDVIGAWNVELEVPHTDECVRGVLTFRSWMEADLDLEPWSAAAASLPERATFERASRVHLTDAGGGALQWVLVAALDHWTVQATLWPGALHLFVQDTDDPDETLYRANATRSREYYLQKYPLVAR